MSDEALLKGLIDENYRVKAFIGQGGMSRIYLAEDIENDQIVALKIVKDDLARDRTHRARFLREVKNAQSLQHKNIVRTFRGGEYDNTLFMAMEYMDGGNFLQLIRRLGTIPWPLALYAMFQISSGLRYSHDLGLIHRDIKPENVMLNSKGEVKIADFGISKTIESTVMTQAGDVLGTPAYMSPEQINGQTLTFKSDLFSCGIVLYEFLTGRNPFMDKSISQTALRILNWNPPPLHELDSMIPEKLGQLVAQMLEKRPERRPRGLMELRGELQSVLMLSPISIDQEKFQQFISGPHAYAFEVRKYLALDALRLTTQSRQHKEVASPEEAVKFFNHLLDLVAYSPSVREIITYIYRILVRWDVKVVRKMPPELGDLTRRFEANPDKTLLGELISRHEALGNTLEVVHYLGLMARLMENDSYIREKIDFQLKHLRKMVTLLLSRDANEQERTRMLKSNEFLRFSEQMAQREILESEMATPEPLRAHQGRGRVVTVILAFLVIGQFLYIIGNRYLVQRGRHSETPGGSNRVSAPHPGTPEWIRMEALERQAYEMLMDGILPREMLEVVRDQVHPMAVHGALSAAMRSEAHYGRVRRLDGLIRLYEEIFPGDVAMCALEMPPGQLPPPDFPARLESVLRQSPYFTTR